MATLRVRILTVEALLCGCEECEKVWVAEGMTPPGQCSRCKSRHWNRAESAAAARPSGTKGSGLRPQKPEHHTSAPESKNKELTFEPTYE